MLQRTPWHSLRYVAVLAEPVGVVLALAYFMQL